MNDDTERYVAFQKAALNWIVQFENKPQIVHCHDYHTGLNSIHGMTDAHKVDVSLKRHPYSSYHSQRPISRPIFI